LVTIDASIDCEKPTESDVSHATAKLRNGRALGICSIPRKFLKYGGSTMVTCDYSYKSSRAFGFQVAFQRTGEEELFCHFTTVKAVDRNAEIIEVSHCSPVREKCLHICCWLGSKISCSSSATQSRADLRHRGQPRIT